MDDTIRKEITDLVEGSRDVYVASVDRDGCPTIKAMYAARVREGIRVHYLSTNTSSRRAKHFLENNKASIYFCDNKNMKGLMLSGTMEVCFDAYHKELIWQPGDTQFYPKGVTDEDYCVFKFTAQKGNYYHLTTNVSFVFDDENWE